MLEVLSKEWLHKKYIIEGHSDKEIAAEIGVDRTTIVHHRKRHGIKTRIYTGETGEILVLNELRKQGRSVINLNELTKTSPFDLLVDGCIRVDVKSAAITSRGSWSFPLTQPPESGIMPCNKLYCPTRTGRIKKDLSKTCDFVVLCCISKQKYFFLIIPSREIPLNLVSLFVSLSSTNKWLKWRNRWDLLDVIH